MHIFVSLTIKTAVVRLFGLKKADGVCFILFLQSIVLVNRFSLISHYGVLFPNTITF